MSRPFRRRMSPSIAETSAAPTPWPRTSGADAIQYEIEGAFGHRSRPVADITDDLVVSHRYQHLVITVGAAGREVDELERAFHLDWGERLDARQQLGELRSICWSQGPNFHGFVPVRAR